jgi:hypothetical protein
VTSEVSQTGLATALQAATINCINAPTGVTDGSYYVLPYSLTIDGKSQTVTCFDFTNDVNGGDTFQASILSLSQASSSGFFTAAYTATYERVALLSARTYNNTDQQVGLQHVIRTVFASVPETPETLNYEKAADTAAASNYAGFDFSHFLQEIGVKAGQPGTEQAFVYRTATPNEPITAAQIAVPEHDYSDDVCHRRRTAAARFAENQSSR